MVDVCVSYLKFFSSYFVFFVYGCWGNVGQVFCYCFVWSYFDCGCYFCVYLLLVLLIFDQFIERGFGKYFLGEIFCELIIVLMVKG